MADGHTVLCLVPVALSIKQEAQSCVHGRFLTYFTELEVSVLETFGSLIHYSGTTV